MFRQEAIVWKRLVHPNVLPLLGITITPSQFVSNWMSVGDLPRYIKETPDADRFRLVGIPPVMFVPRLPPLPVVRHRQGPLLPPFLQCDSWGPQGSTLLFTIPLHHHTYPYSAEHSCG